MVLNKQSIQRYFHYKQPIILIKANKITTALEKSIIPTIKLCRGIDYRNNDVESTGKEEYA